MRRTVKPDDVGKTLTINCNCSHWSCDGTYKGEVAMYLMGDKSNCRHPHQDGHDRFLFRRTGITVTLNFSIAKVEVEDGPDPNP